MMLPSPTPLAWLNLIHERRRLATALAGVAFSVLLMFIFLGFKNALFDSQVRLLTRLNGDIVITNKLKYFMFVPEQFARRRLYQAMAFEGVEAAYPLYITTANWKNPQTRRIYPMRVLAFDPQDPVLMIPGIEDYQAQLQRPQTVLIDSQSSGEVGPKQTGIQTELAEQRVQVVGTFPLGTDFAADNGNLIMSDQNFLRYFAQLGPEKDRRSLNTVDVGLLKVAPGTNLATLVTVLRRELPQDVAILSREEFVQQERVYWQENTNIAFVFSLLTTVSFMVGVILVYQILYTDVADHWAEYGTLKAMGYSNRYLLVVVTQEALLLGILGFIPGCLASWGLYHLTSQATGLLMQMTTVRVVRMLGATLIMCLISGAIAMKKVQAADPAEVFGA